MMNPRENASQEVSHAPQNQSDATAYAINLTPQNQSDIKEAKQEQQSEVVTTEAPETLPSESQLKYLVTLRRQEYSEQVIRLYEQIIYIYGQVPYLQNRLERLEDAQAIVNLNLNIAKITTVDKEYETLQKLWQNTRDPLESIRLKQQMQALERTRQVMGSCIEKDNHLPDLYRIDKTISTIMGNIKIKLATLNSEQALLFAARKKSAEEIDKLLEVVPEQHRVLNTLLNDAWRICKMAKEMKATADKHTIKDERKRYPVSKMVRHKSISSHSSLFKQIAKRQMNPKIARAKEAYIKKQQSHEAPGNKKG